MVPWSVLGTATVPGDGGELRLRRRGAEFSITLGQNELMNSRLRGSEEALATLSLARLQSRDRARVLIGGLGMGYTTRAALAQLGGQARVTVAELVPAVVAWARGPLCEIFGESLHDPRIDVVEADVGHLIRSARSQYDAILLDVDNGPEALTREANDALYGTTGLCAARTALRPGGVFSVWSCAPDRRFADRLARAEFGVEEIRVRANGTGGGARHVIWIATKPAARKRPDRQERALRS